MAIQPAAGTTKPAKGSAVNTASSLSTGLVAALLFNDTTGSTALDASTNANNMALGTAVSWVSTPFGGGIDGELSAAPVGHTDQSGGQTGTLAQFATSPAGITFIGRVKIKSSDLANGAQIWSLGNYTKLVYQVTAWQLKIYNNNTGNTPVATIPLDTWTTIAQTYDSTSGVSTLVVDGVAIALNSPYTTANQTLNGQLFLGTIAPFSGQWEYLYLYDRAVSLADLQTITGTPFAMINAANTVVPLTTTAVSIGTPTATTETMDATNAVHGNTGPYTYRWYLSTTQGFTPGPSNFVSGATTATPTFTGLTPDTIYYCKLAVTDSASTPVTLTTGQMAFVTEPATMGTIVLVGIGDSIMALEQTGVTETPLQACADYLTAQAGIRKVIVVNQAVAGTALSDWQPGGTKLTAAFAAGNAAKAAAGVAKAIYVVMLGANDSKAHGTAAGYGSALNLTLQAIVTNGDWAVPNAPTYSYQPGGGWDEAATALQQAYGATIPALCDGVNVRDGDPGQGYKWFAAFNVSGTVDGVHPDAAGVQALGLYWYQGIVKSFNLGGTTAVVVAPSIGAISVVVAAGTATITFPAPVAGTNPVGGVALYQGPASGQEAWTPIATHAGTTGGTFAVPVAAPGSSLTWAVKAYDNQTTPLYGAASNEVSYTTPLPLVNLAIDAYMVAAPGDPALHPDASVADPGCQAPAPSTTTGVLTNAAQIVAVATDADRDVSIDVTGIIGTWTATAMASATLAKPFTAAVAAPNQITAAPVVVLIAATQTTAARTLVQLSVLDGTQAPGDVYDVHVTLTLNDAPATRRTLVFSVYVEAD